MGKSQLSHQGSKEIIEVASFNPNSKSPCKKGDKSLSFDESTVVLDGKPHLKIESERKHVPRKSMKEQISILLRSRIDSRDDSLLPVSNPPEQK